MLAPAFLSTFQCAEQLPGMPGIGRMAEADANRTRLQRAGAFMRQGCAMEASPDSNATTIQKSRQFLAIPLGNKADRTALGRTEKHAIAQGLQALCAAMGFPFLRGSDPAQTAVRQ